MNNGLTEGSVAALALTGSRPGSKRPPSDKKRAAGAPRRAPRRSLSPSAESNPDQGRICYIDYGGKSARKNGDLVYPIRGMTFVRLGTRGDAKGRGEALHR